MIDDGLFVMRVPDSKLSSQCQRGPVKLQPVLACLVRLAVRPPKVIVVRELRADTALMTAPPRQLDSWQVEWSNIGHNVENNIAVEPCSPLEPGICRGPRLLDASCFTMTPSAPQRHSLAAL